MRHAPGTVRDSIISYLSAIRREATVAEILSAVTNHIGSVASSSVRSCLNLHTRDLFERTGKGRYRLRLNESTDVKGSRRRSRV